MIVRYLVGTPPAQARRAAAVIDGADELGVALVALLETGHVLRTQYGVARLDVVSALIEFVTRENVIVLGLQNAEALEALVRARSLPGGPIADAFIAVTARSAGALPLYTFDEGMGRHGVAVATP